MKLADLILQAFPSLPSHAPNYLKEWTPGTTPLSTTPVVLSVMVGYLTTIFSIRAYMNASGRPAFVMNSLFRAHNIVLSVGSGILLLLMVEEIGPVVINRGLRGAICDEEAWTPRMEFYYIVNYYIKYYELIDTVFLALKKKPLAFLHVFHHAATALLCFNQLNGRTPVSWTVITINLFVHVIMYYYYYGTAGGRRFWWKQHVTTMQISQFVIDLCIVYYATFQLFSHRLHDRYPSILPKTRNCAGSENAALFGCGLLSSYLFLFIQFFIATYLNKGKAAKGRKSEANGKAIGAAAAAANGVANGIAMGVNGHANGNGVAKLGL